MVYDNSGDNSGYIGGKFVRIRVMNQDNSARVVRASLKRFLKSPLRVWDFVGLG